MNNEISLRFLQNNAGEAEGLGDAGIETFRGSPYISVARETAQNSRDARYDENSPVLLKIDCFSLKSIDLPEIESFKQAAKSCLEKANKLDSEKERDFFKRALDVLENENINILSIQDFNTTGVYGPCEEGKPFHALVKADGVSLKSGTDSSGSFGIGKSAVFALSELQTVFYSTKYTNDSGDQALFMGKTLFISHKGVDGLEYGKKGYLGFSNFMPIDLETKIPKKFQRKEQGTSIFSIGVRPAQYEWSYEILSACLINFFSAIHNNDMQFEIDNRKITLNKYTLGGWFNDSKLLQVVNSLQLNEAFETAKRLYRCLVDTTSKVEFIRIKNMGQIKIHLLLGENIGHTVGIVRNGMYITDNLSNFGESFKRFPLYREFTALMEPNDQKSSEWFKRVENPSHDSLSAERITSSTKREMGQKIFTDLGKQFRDEIKKFAKPKLESAIDLNELNEFFALENSKTSELKGTIKKELQKEPTQIRKTQVNRASRLAKQHGTNDDVIKEKNNSSIHLTKHKNNFDKNTQQNKNASNKSKPNNNISVPKGNLVPNEYLNERNVLSHWDKKKNRRIFFNIPFDGKVKMSVHAVGLSTKEQLCIVNTDVGEIRDGNIYLDCNNNQRYSINVEFSTEYTGPIEIDAVYLGK